MLEEATLNADLYAEVVKDPLTVALIVAVFSALVAVLLSQLANLGYVSWTHRRKRKSVLRILRNQLENHGVQLRELRDSLGKNRICSPLDPSPVLHFLSSTVVTLPKDQTLVTAFYEHLSNIGRIRSVLDIIAMSSAGFTSVQNTTKEELEKNLKQAIPDCLKGLDVCLEALPK